MKLQELLDILAQVPDKSVEVILAQDEGGNSHSPIDFVSMDPGLVYSPEVRAKDRSIVTVEIGYAALTEDLRKDGFTEDDVFENGQPCVVLYPRR